MGISHNTKIRKQLKSRKTLLITIAVASVLSINTVRSTIPTMAYGSTTEIENNQDQMISGMTAKSNADEVGLQGTKLSISKSSKDTKYVLDKQVETLKEAKLEDERKEKERLEKEAREKEEAIRLQKEAEAALAAQVAQAAKEAEEEKAREGSKMVISSESEARKLDIRSKSNWSASDFDKVLPARLKCVIPVALRLEKELGINALYTISVAANETGWGQKLAGQNNYFNWSSDGIKSFDFDSIQSFSDYSVKGYKKFLNTSFYADTVGNTDRISVETVNTKYAINRDGSINWEWTRVVASIMKRLSDQRLGR